MVSAIVPRLFFIIFSYFGCQVPKSFDLNLWIFNMRIFARIIHLTFRFIRFRFRFFLPRRMWNYFCVVIFVVSFLYFCILANAIRCIVCVFVCTRLRQDYVSLRLWARACLFVCVCYGKCYVLCTTTDNALSDICNRIAYIFSIPLVNLYIYVYFIMPFLLLVFYCLPYESVRVYVSVWRQFCCCCCLCCAAASHYDDMHSFVYSMRNNLSS